MRKRINVLRNIRILTASMQILLPHSNIQVSQTQEAAFELGTGYLLFGPNSPPDPSPVYLACFEALLTCQKPEYNTTEKNGSIMLQNLLIQLLVSNKSINLERSCLDHDHLHQGCNLLLKVKV